MSTGNINEEQGPVLKCKDGDTKSVKCRPIQIVPKDEVLSEKAVSDAFQVGAQKEVLHPSNTEFLTFHLNKKGN